MKILYITHVYNSLIKDQIECLAKSVEEVNVLVRFKQIAGILSKFPINSLKKHSKEFAINLNDLPDNVHVYTTEFNYFPNQFFYLRIGKKHFNRVQKCIKKHNIKFDIIHAHKLWSAGFVAVKLKELYSVPAIITAHGGDAYKLPYINKKWNAQIRSICESADAIINVSGSDYSALNKTISFNKNIIPNGYDSAKFYKKDKYQSRKILGIGKDELVLINIGHLFKIKGQILILKAVKNLIVEKRNIKLYLVGNGPEYNNLKTYINKHSLDSNVTLIGQISHLEINEWLNAADFFVLSSFNEGNPTVLFESMATGTPFLSTNVGGVPEIIVNKKHGLLIDVGDYKAIIKAIKNACEIQWDESKILEYSKKYSWDNLSIKIYNLYNSTIKKRN